MLSLMAKEVTDAEIGTVARRWQRTEVAEKEQRRSRGSKEKAEEAKKMN